MSTLQERLCAKYGPLGYDVEVVNDGGSRVFTTKLRRIVDRPFTIATPYIKLSFQTTGYPVLSYGSLWLMNDTLELWSENIWDSTPDVEVLFRKAFATIPTDVWERGLRGVSLAERTLVRSSSGDDNNLAAMTYELDAVLRRYGYKQTAPFAVEKS